MEIPIEYTKINTIFKRTERGRIIEGEFSLDEFSYLSQNTWVFTEKVDGTNIRVWLRHGENPVFAGKTKSSQIPSHLVQSLVDMFFPERKDDERYPSGIVLFGEGYGPKIQNGEQYRADQSFVLFDAWINGLWLRREDLEDIASKMKIDIVPIIGDGTLSDMVELARSGFTSTWGEFQAEGIVARPKTELLSRGGKRIITKIKTKDFKA